MPDHRDREEEPASGDNDENADGLVDSDATTQADLGMSGAEAPAGAAPHPEPSSTDSEPPADDDPEPGEPPSTP